MLEICLTIDKNAAESGFVTVFSLLEHAKEKVAIMVCFDCEDGLPATDWAERLAKNNFDFDLRFQSVDNRAFRGTKPMFDSYACYLRHSAPDYAVRCERLLYIDADIVFTDWDFVSEIYHMDMGSAAVAMLQSGTCGARPSKERLLLDKFGKKDTDPYFGGTIALIDVARYRQRGMRERCEKLAAEHAASLLYHDQSIWNAVLSMTDATPIPTDPRWQEAGRSGPLHNFVPGMIHVCGAPKPWDVLGEKFHPYYRDWADVAERAGLSQLARRNYFDVRALKRAWRIRKQYAVWLGPIVNKL